MATPGQPTAGERIPTPLEVARQSARGGVILLAGNLGSVTTNAVAIILVARLLGPTDYGVYTLALLIPTTLQLFTGFGVNTAVMRYSAYYASTGRTEDAKRLTRRSIEFHVFTGAVFSLLQFILAGYLATYVLLRPSMAPLLQVSAVYVVCQSVLLTGVASAIGWKWMSLASYSQVLQSAVKLVLGPALILLGFSVYGALSGAIASPLIGGLLAVSALAATKLRGVAAERPPLRDDLSKMIRYGAPAYTGTLLNGLAASFLVLVLAAIASNATVGFYQAATNFTTTVLLVSVATANSLIPAFATLDGIGGNLAVALNRAAKYVAAAIMGVVFFMVAAAGPMVTVLYGASFGQSAAYLRLLAVATAPIAAGFVVLPVFFNGTGRTRLTLLTYLTGSATLVILAPLLSVPLGLGVPGLIYALLISYSAASAAGILLARRYASAGIGIRPLASLLAAGALSCLGSYAIPYYISSNLAALLVQLVVFTAIFLSLVPLLRGLELIDLVTLENTLGGLRYVGAPASRVLRYMEAVLAATSRSKGGG
jgi:O-antigen/teichoic acid export membrane protein